MLVDELARNMQMGKQTDLILLDLSIAFDKDSHEKKLLLKLINTASEETLSNGLKTFWIIGNGLL